MIPKIYLLDGSRALTGAFVAARNIARALAGMAHVVLVIPQDADIGPEQTKDFAEVVRLPLYPLRRSFLGIALYIPALLKSSYMLNRHMQKHRASALVINDFYMMQGAVARLFGFRGRLVTWVRINPAAFGRVSRVWLRAVKISSHRVVAVSNHIQKLISTVPTIVLYDSISDECSPQVEPGAEISRTFIYVGNYIAGKGQDIALEALARVVSDFPEVRIDFYGGDMGIEKNRQYLQSLEARADALGISKHVSFHGFEADPRNVLAGKFAALNLSRAESFSMTVLEASACGLAVIATRSGGPEEIIDDGRSGLLVPIDDVDACARAMMGLCENPELARMMGRAGRERALRVFSREAFFEGLMQVLGPLPMTRLE